MKINCGLYYFATANLYVGDDIEVQKETPKCYFTQECRFDKEKQGVVRSHFGVHQPYLEVYVVDSNNPKQDIEEKMSGWFEQEACRIKSEKRTRTNDQIRNQEEQERD